MKQVIIFSLVIAVGAGVYWFNQSSSQSRECWEDWIANTKELFQSATAIFDNASFPSMDEPEEENASLDALLPEGTLPPTPNAQESITENPSVDWRYKPDVTATVTAKTKETKLLPNLFENTENGPETSLSGQLHLDESDNIIGAEVGIAIPTN